MKAWLYKLKSGFQRFMYGRYGGDELGKAAITLGWVLIILSLVLSLFNSAVMAIVSRVVSAAAFAVIILSLLRTFSKQVGKRAAENRRYLELRAKVASYFARLKDKEHRYYKCPKCKVVTRVPRGKGKIKITCPKCKESFIRTT